MKAENLSIGDIVKVVGFAYSVRVKAIFKTTEGYEIFTHDGERLKENQIQAKSLTDEVFEKNGFVTWLDENSELCYRLPDTDIVIYKKDYCIKFGRSYLCLMYVHELQHILRLSGIDKQIEVKLKKY